MIRNLTLATGVALLCMPLAGCWKDQQAATRACSATYPRPHDDIVYYDLRVKLAKCMEVKGYRFAIGSVACAGAPNPGRTPECFEPDGLAARWGYRVEMMFHPRKLPPGHLQS